jgi:hypothetical protein
MEQLHSLIKDPFVSSITLHLTDSEDQMTSYPKNYINIVIYMYVAMFAH